MRAPRYPRCARRARAEAGFTLIELMISLVLFSFAIAGILSIAVTMVSGFREQRLAINTEAAARMSIELISDAIRGAAPGVQDGSKIQHTSICTGGVGVSGSFSLVNSTTAPDSLVVVYPSGAVITSLRTTYNAASTAESVTLTDASQLSVGDTLLVTSTEQGHLARITAISGNVVTLAARSCTLTLAPPTGGYPPGTLVIRAERVQFFVANDTSVTPPIPTLWMDPDAEGQLPAEPLAEGIEDFQVQAAIDANGDGTVAASEWYHGTSGTTLPAGTVRGVRIWMVARATSGIINATYQRPAAGDRAAATSTDTFRRRLLTSTVEVRNNKLSP